MKIGIIGSLETRTPPRKYGGTEFIVSKLTEGLVQKGHEVTLFASGDSITSARLIPGSEEALMDNGYPINPNAAYLLMLDKVVSMSGEFDIIHNHLGWRFLPSNKYCQCPVLNTYHAYYGHPRVKFFFEHYKDLNYTSLSMRQRADLNLNFVACIYNGIEIEKFSCDTEIKNDNLVYISRFDEQKGSHTAIEIALELNKKITVIGRPEKENPKQYQYYLDRVKPLMENLLVEDRGELSPEEKAGFLKNSKLFLFPVNWEEPFGLVLVEAMATGTPVVAFARGAVPEVVRDGETGFIVNQSEHDNRGDWIVKKTGVEGLKEAVEKVYSLSDEQYREMRKACRRRVEDNFTIEKMVNGYEEVYRRLTNKA